MLVHPLPDPVAFWIGPISVKWYGLMYLVAFALFIVLGRVRVRKPHIAAQGWKKEHLDDMLFYGVLGVIIGGRLGEVLLYRPAYFLAHPEQIIQTWNGGMSFYGGFLGVMLAMAFWAKRNGRRLMEVMDFIAPLIPLGYAAGRLGNFINAELPGRLADPGLPWAMIWPNVDSLPRHPSPIYQMLIDGVLLFIVLWWFSRRARPAMAVSGVFALGYGLARFFTEFFRTPESLFQVLGVSLSSSQGFSLLMMLLGAVLLMKAYRPASEPSLLPS